MDVTKVHFFEYPKCFGMFSCLITNNFQVVMNLIRNIFSRPYQKGDYRDKNHIRRNLNWQRVVNHYGTASIEVRHKCERYTIRLPFVDLSQLQLIHSFFSHKMSNAEETPSSCQCREVGGATSFERSSQKKMSENSTIF